MSGPNIHDRRRICSINSIFVIDRNGNILHCKALGPRTWILEKRCAMADPSLASMDLSKLVLAIGGLGTAAYGLVDATKGLWGGISHIGFGDIKKVISELIPPAAPGGRASAITLESAYDTLRANWMNGMAMPDQKSVAKALVKLNLTPQSANDMALATGVDAALLTSVAQKLQFGVNDKAADKTLTDAESNVYGRFDVLLSALLDQAYQRGDQRYRNCAKLLAMAFSVPLAVAGFHYVLGPDHKGMGFLAGLLAVPLAPVAKDLASTIQAGAKIAQLWKK